MPVYPVPIFRGMIPSISDSFGHSPRRGRLHAGADIMYRRKEPGISTLPVSSKHYMMPNNVPALAFASGKVTQASVIGTGGRVEIDHGNGLSTKYFHLRNMKVRPGQTVNAGDPIGSIFHNVSGYKLNHLHFETLKNGQHVNPASLLSQATKVEVPDQWGFLLNIGLAIGAGLLLNKYVFK